MPCDTVRTVKTVLENVDQKAMVKALKKLGYDVNVGQYAIHFTKDGRSYNYSFGTQVLSARSTEYAQIIQQYNVAVCDEQFESFGWEVSEENEEEKPWQL